MFGLGFPELIVICVIALLVFGPKKIPGAGKAIGEAIRGFRSSLEGKDESAIPAASPSSPTACSGCGKALEANAAFCAHCGRSVSDTSRARTA